MKPAGSTTFSQILFTVQFKTQRKVSALWNEALLQSCRIANCVVFGPNLQLSLAHAAGIAAKSSKQKRGSVAFVLITDNIESIKSISLRFGDTLL